MKKVIVVVGSCVALQLTYPKDCTVSGSLFCISASDTPSEDVAGKGYCCSSEDLTGDPNCSGSSVVCTQRTFDLAWTDSQKLAEMAVRKLFYPGLSTQRSSYCPL
jgi:hypothetical protein